jgi:O-antigen ligase
MRSKEGMAVAATVLAVAVPMLVAHTVPAANGLVAQICAVGLWGIAVAAWSLAIGPTAGLALAPLVPLLCALGLVALGVAASALARGAPGAVWAGSLAVIAAAALAALGGARAAAKRPEPATRALMRGLVLAAGLSLLIAAFQLAAPGWADPRWVAAARTPGRANANLIHPNDLASLLLWAWLAVAAWPSRATALVRTAAGTGLSSQGGAAPSAGFWAFMVAFAMQAGLAATASRAGLVASLMLAMWAALDRRLPRPTAWLLWITALGGLAITLGRVLVAPVASLGAGASLVRPGARGGVFVDALQLVRDHPLVGVGWMEFQSAWSLSPMGDRGPRYFEHPHNLVMHLITELGVPLGAAISGCLIWGAWRLLGGLARVAQAQRLRALMLAGMLAAVGVLSLFDAPFWRAHLLLPAAWAWGCLAGLIARADDDGEAPRQFAERRSPHEAAWRARARAGLAAGGAALAVAAVAAWIDLRPVAVALAPSARGAPPATAGPSRLFGHYAAYREAVTTANAAPEVFRRARWATIDTALLAAWIASLERTGRPDEARHLMQRALEFRDPAFAPWLAACRVVPPLEPPSRCLAAGKAPSWRDFR